MIIAICWGTQIDLVPIIVADQMEKIEFKVSSYFENDYDILFMSWVSKNLILCVDQQNNILLLQTFKFVDKNHDNSN